MLLAEFLVFFTNQISKPLRFSVDALLELQVLFSERVVLFVLLNTLTGSAGICF